MYLNLFLKATTVTLKVEKYDETQSIPKKYFISVSPNIKISKRSDYL